MAKLLLADGSSQIHRTYHALARQGTLLTAPDGTPTGALLSFVNVLRKAVRKYQPTHLAVTFDLRGPTFRHEKLPSYKAQRDKTPEDLVRQIELAREVLAALRIPLVEREGFEADDVIATLASSAAERGDDVVILSSDKDLLQLVGPRVVMHHALRDELMDEAAVVAYMGVPPDRIVDLLAIRGDSSDNIPGVRGIGEKGALQLVQAHGTLEAMLGKLEAIAADESLGKLRKRMAQLLGEQTADARLAKELVTLARNVPLDLGADALVVREPDAPATREILTRLGLTRLLAELKLPGGDAPAGTGLGPRPARGSDVDAALPGPGPGPVPDAPAAPQPARARSVDVFLTTRADDAAKLASAARAAGRLVLAADVAGGKLAGLAMLVPGQSPRVLPVGSPALDEPAVREALADARLAKTGHDLKATMKLLAREGVTLAGCAFDTELASFVLDAGRRSHDLAQVALEILGEAPAEAAPASAAPAQGTLSFPDEKDAARRAGERADVARRLEDAMRPMLEAANLSRVLDGLDMPLVPILAEMELAGVRIDVAELDSLRGELQARLDEITAKCHECAGREFNLASPKQLGEILYDQLGLASGAKTSTGARSTAQDVLEELAGEHPIIDLILEHRELSKLIGTYLEALPRLVDPRDGRVHTNYRQAAAVTGRLSSIDPNLQNIPIRSELGRRIRKAFVAEPGFLLVGADYSQIELRIMADLSGDAALCEAFARDEDVHRATAAKMFHVMPELVTSEMRNRAKVINFGLLYGMTAHGVSTRLGCSRAEAKALIDGYFGAYPRMKETVDRLIEDARQDPRHEARTIFGRVRRLEEIVSRNGGRRQFAERAAVNTVVQGTAADLMKLAMIAAHARLKAEHPRARMLLQVHDELVVEAPEAEAPGVLATLIGAMEGVHAMKAPLKAVGGIGSTWYSLK